MKDYVRRIDSAFNECHQGVGPRDDTELLVDVEDGLDELRAVGLRVLHEDQQKLGRCFADQWV